MKNKKKINNLIYIILVVIVLLVLLLVLLLPKQKKEVNKNPRELVKEYIEKYKKLDDSVTKNIEYPFQDNLSNLQKERYEGIIKFKLEQIEYFIVEGEETATNENDAVITIKINTVDINAAYEKASTYIDSHKEEFATVEDEIEYKLDTISKYDLKEEYQISFNFYKKDGKWKMAEPSKSDLNKIKGLY